MKTQMKMRGAALTTAGVLAISSLGATSAQAKTSSKDYKAGAVVLGALGVILAAKGKTLPAVIIGAGAYYAYKKSQDNDDRYDNVYPDSNDRYSSNNRNNRRDNNVYNSGTVQDDGDVYDNNVYNNNVYNNGSDSTYNDNSTYNNGYDSNVSNDNVYGDISDSNDNQNVYPDAAINTRSRTARSQNGRWQNRRARSARSQQAQDNDIAQAPSDKNTQNSSDDSQSQNDEMAQTQTDDISLD